MTVSFDGIPFGVLTTDGRLPLPDVEESTMFSWYEAEIFVTSRAQVMSLRALVTQVTPKPAIGQAFTGTVIVERGEGQQSLIYPDGDAEVTVNAILTRFIVRGFIERQDVYRCSAKWLITGTLS